MKEKKGKQYKKWFIGIGVVIAGVVMTATVFALRKQDEGTEPVPVELIEIVVQNASTGGRKAAGTGVVYHVEKDGIWIATTNHVLYNKGVEDQIILALAGEEAECTTWVEIEETDLAYLYLPPESTNTMEMVPVNIDKTSYDNLAEGAIVEVRGYYCGEPVEYQGTLTDSWIYVEDFAQYMMLADCEISPGMSGGGMYDTEGHFIGMICGGNENGELVAVPWHVMQARFEENVGKVEVLAWDF